MEAGGHHQLTLIYTLLCGCVAHVTEKIKSEPGLFYFFIYLLSLDTVIPVWRSRVQFPSFLNRLSTPRMASPPSAQTHSDSSWYNGTMLSYSLSLQSGLQNTVHSNSDRSVSGITHYGVTQAPLTLFLSRAQEALGAVIMHFSARDIFTLL